MNNLTEVYVVRHAESEGNVGILHGEKHELGSHLTEKGQKQAHLLRDKLKGIHFDAIFSSDMNRTRQTAEIIALERNLAINTSSLIRERSIYQYFDRIPNKSPEEIRDEMMSDLRKLDEIGKMEYKHSPIMESAKEGAERLLAIIREAAVAYAGKRLLFASHGNIMRSALTLIGFAKFNELPAGAIENTGYFILESDGVDFFVKDVVGVHKQIDAIRDF